MCLFTEKTMEEIKVKPVLYYDHEIESPESIYAVLRDYLIFKGAPRTYFDKERLNLQCLSGKNRSIDDLILIVNRFFPDAEVKDVMKALLELYEVQKADPKWHGSLLLYRCSDIMKPVIMTHQDPWFSENCLVPMVFESHIQIDAKGYSKYSMVGLYELCKQILAEK